MAELGANAMHLACVQKNAQDDVEAHTKPHHLPSALA